MTYRRKKKKKNKTIRFWRGMRGKSLERGLSDKVVFASRPECGCDRVRSEGGRQWKAKRRETNSLK